MDHETLERLMIDDALDALSPDVSELLAAHTSADDRAKWKGIAQLARATGEATASLPLPAMPRRPIQFRSVLATAAMVLLGIGLGLWMPRGSAPSPVVWQSPPPATVPQPTPAVGVRDFWSSDRLIAAAMQNPAMQNPRIHSSAPRWTLHGDLR